jgi:hypothetical protein
MRRTGRDKLQNSIETAVQVVSDKKYKYVPCNQMGYGCDCAEKVKKQMQCFVMFMLVRILKKKIL